MIAINDLARRDCNVATDLELVGADSGACRKSFSRNLRRGSGILGLGSSPAFECSLLHDRIGRRKFDGDSMSRICREANSYDVLVLLRDTLDTGDRTVPPLLLQ